MAGSTPTLRFGSLALSRTVAGVLAVALAVGNTWFGESGSGAYSLSDTIFFCASLTALVTFAALPRNVLRHVVARGAALVVYAVAVVSVVPQIQHDLKLVGGADYPAVVLRTIICGIFILGEMEAWSHRVAHEAI